MIVLVVGPPCSGKTTWVRQQAQPGDTIVDFDDIREEIGAGRYDNRPVVVDRAKAIWKQRITAAHPGTTWVIWANPARWQRADLRNRYGAKVVLVMAPIEVCLERARAERPPEWQGVVTHWFRTWQPSTTVPEFVVSGVPPGKAEVPPASETW